MAEQPDFTATRTGTRALILRGELDLSTVRVLTDALDSLEHGDVVIDLGGLTFLDARGLGAFVRTSNSMREHELALTLVNHSPRVRRTFVAAQVGHLLAAS